MLMLRGMFRVFYGWIIGGIGGIGKGLFASNGGTMMFLSCDGPMIRLGIFMKGGILP